MRHSGSRSIPSLGTGRKCAAAVLLIGLATGPTSAQDQDAISRGELLFGWCDSCHSVIPGEDGLQGPNLFGIVGSLAASRAGFPYSDALVALRKQQVIWAEDVLDAFLADPLGFAPRNTMGSVDMDDPTARADLIAYLRATAEERSPPEQGD
ncbi:MAG: cytochrome c family protein [Pseudomonadota bacterium]